MMLNKMANKKKIFRKINLVLQNSMGIKKKYLKMRTVDKILMKSLKMMNNWTKNLKNQIKNNLKTLLKKLAEMMTTITKKETRKEDLKAKE